MPKYLDQGAKKTVRIFYVRALNQRSSKSNRNSIVAQKLALEVAQGEKKHGHSEVVTAKKARHDHLREHAAMDSGGTVQPHHEF
jgi:hypothetical protein